VSQSEPDVSGWVEATGRTVAEATQVGLELIGLQTPEGAEVEVLEEPQRGLLGLGGRSAKVRVRLKRDKAGALAKTVRDILSVLDIPGAEVTARRDDDGYIRIDVNGPNLGILIGRRGETLDALQYLLNLSSVRHTGFSERVILDVGGYRERRRVVLERLAGRIAETVRRNREEAVLEPMTAHERKVIHMALAAEEGVRSESRGEDPFRRVVVSPSDKSQDEGE